MVPLAIHHRAKKLSHLDAPGRLRRGAAALVKWGVAAAGSSLVVLLAVAASRAQLEAPAATSLVRSADGQFLGEVGDKGLGYWPIDPFPARVAAATIAIEDRRFWSHPGVDPWAIGRALVRNFQLGRRTSGASTLAMQIARMQRPGPRTYPRKLLEAVTAVMITARYGREAILAHYLRLVPYGNRYHGIGYAARRYLDKPVEDLSWAEIAFLSAIPQAPSRMNPYKPMGRARVVERGRRILGRLLERATLSESEYTLAMHEIARLVVLPRSVRPDVAMHAILGIERRLETYASREATGKASAVAQASSVRSDRGLLITATLRLDLQRTVAEMVWRAARAWEQAGVGNIAAMVVDLERYSVVASVGSSDYFDVRHKGAIDYTRVSRPSGSTLKPFLYALALDRGTITPATILDDLERGPEGLGNADDRFLGPMLPRVALANSRNVPAVRLLVSIGLDEGYSLFREMGLHDDAVPARHYGLGMAIGGLPVSLEQLVQAYTALAGDGRVHPLTWYEGQHLAEPTRVFSDSTARQLSLFLSDPVARLPTFPRMGASEYPFPVAVKTGTSTNYRDAWTVEYTGRYLVGVWVGHPDYRSMRHMSGFRSAARLVRDIVLHLHGDELDGRSDFSFPSPQGFEAHRLCALSGALAGDVCDQVFLEWFSPGTAPVESCRVHVPRGVDVRTGEPATQTTPRDFVEVRTFVDLAPRYGAWAARNGVPLLRRPDPAQRSSVARDGSLAADVSTAPTALSLDPAFGLLNRTVRVSITSPEENSRILRDPETPARMATLALHASVVPPVEQLVWYIDGEPFRVVDFPYATRWPMTPGEHSVEARVPFTRFRSQTVRITLE